MSVATLKDFIVPLDLSLENKKIGQVWEDSTFLNPQGHDPVFALLGDLPNSAPKQRLFGLLPPKPNSPCPGSCVTILGAAQYRKNAGALICSKLWSKEHGPMMVLVLAEFAHVCGLVLKAEGPFSPEALQMLRRLVAEPIANLSVQECPAESFSFAYVPSPALDAEFSNARERFRKQLQKSALDPVHQKYCHTQEGLATFLRTTYLVKASLAHR